MADRTHDLVLGNIDIKNLVQKMIDIWVFKIGGDPNQQRIYDFNIVCNHSEKSLEGDSGRHCIKDEFCEYGHFIDRDF